MPHLARLGAALVLLTLALPLAGQEHPNVARGLGGATVQAGDLDQVNLFNGNLVLAIPIGAPYPVGGGLSYGLGLVYNSNVWDYQSREVDPITHAEVVQALPTRRANAGLGWTLSLGGLFSPGSPGNDTNAWVYTEPDGSTHNFYPKLHEGDPEDAGDTATFQKVRYSRDGSYLRLVNRGTNTAPVMEIEAPGGEIRKFDSQGRLTRIESRFSASWVTITYAGNPVDEWQIADSHGRLQTVTFRHDLPEYPSVVSTVSLEAFRGTSNQRVTAVYTFEHTPATVARSCLNSDEELGDPVDVPLLTAIVLPDGSRYSMPVEDYLTSRPAGLGICQAPGAILGLTLPTLGRLEWDYQTYTFPNDSSNKPPRQKVPGVATRTVKDAAGTVLGQWSYTTALATSTSVPADEMINTVTDPLGHRTVHYFSVYTGAEGITPAGWSAYDYALPFTRRVSDGAGRFLSTQVFDSANRLLRSNYLRHEMDQRAASAGVDRNLNRRVAGSRTVYEDDNGRFADLDLSNFDGLGHYRQTRTGGSFAGSNVRTSVTGYNPSAGTYRLDGSGNPLPGFTMLPASSPWILGTFDRRSVTEGSYREASQAYFNPTTGFLERQRVLLDPDGPGPEDGVAVFAPDTFGNLSREEYFGGDGATLDTVQTLRDLPLPSNQIRIDHVFAKGALQSSTYVNGAGSALPFTLVDRTLDITGLPSSSRDEAGIQTAYLYDAMGRLTWSRPDQGAWTEVTYNRAVSASNLADIEVRQHPNGGGATVLAQSETLFDALGRPWRERQLLPDGTWTVVETLYDAAGNRLSVSQPQTGTPNRKTQFLGYDPFGRPGTLRPPDGAAHDVTLAYKGVSQVERTVRVATAQSGGTVTESPARTTEVYDRLGRLIEVTEPSGAAGADITTFYQYDAADRLRQVSTTARVGGLDIPQLRKFEYDGRGFLTSETHPEKGLSGNGTITYSSFNARGAARRREEGTEVQTFAYDRAERLFEVRDGASRLIKRFTYGISNGTGDARRGRLVEASRYQYPVLGGVTHTAQISETYTYGGLDGRVSQRDTRLTFNSAAAESFRQTFESNALGQTRATGYPVCTHASCAQARPATFADVPSGHPAQAEIDALFNAGITGGCRTSPTFDYCPGDRVNRAQMAVFLLKAKEGTAYSPPACTNATFSDVPCSHWASAWIYELVRRGITGGCGGGRYCVDDFVTQAQMAVFLLATREGTGFAPPACAAPTFDDVSCSYWAAAWIGEASRQGIRAGCGNGDYCPESQVTRAEMAGLLVRTFSLPMSPLPATGRNVVASYTAGRLTSVGGYASLTYHPNLMIHQVVHTNGVVDTQANDPNALHRPASVTSTAGATTLWTTGSYSYDGAGNITKMGTSWFTYDKVSRLASATLFLGATGGGTQVQQSYTFDPFGNLTAITGNQGRTIPVNPRTNRLSSPTAGYDLGGNLTAWNGAAYEHDAFDQMQRMTSGTEDWFYFYTADGERIWSYNVAANVSRWTLRDLDGKVLREFRNDNGAWSLASDYIYRDGALLAAETPSGVRHFHLDHLGSPRLITNGAGVKMAFHVYYPFGEEATAFNQDSERMKLTGHERDFASLAGTGDDLDYMHARHASPLLGRFLSFDPIGGSLRAPQSWNRYAYVLGNPLKLIDPYGLRSQPIAKFEGSITVTASASGILMSDLTTADRLYIYGIGYASLLGLATRDDGLSPFAVGIGREVWASTGFISVYGDKAAAAVDYLTGYASAIDALLLDGDPTEVGVQVSLAMIPGPYDNLGAAGLRLTFKSAHAGRHLVGTGLEQRAVEAAIREAVEANAAHLAGTQGPFRGLIEIGGKTIEYRGFVHPDGAINIGTYYIPRGLK